MPSRSRISARSIDSSRSDDNCRHRCRRDRDDYYYYEYENGPNPLLVYSLLRPGYGFGPYGYGGFGYGGFGYGGYGRYGLW